MGAPDYTCANLIANALAIPEGEDFLFAHALIQEGAYSSMLRSRRRELHVRAAEWYSERDLTLCAQHFDRADDERAAKAYLGPLPRNVLATISRLRSDWPPEAAR